MNHPKTNPFTTPMTEQVITTRAMTSEDIRIIIDEFFGEDGMILSVHKQAATAWVRVRGWWEDTKSFEDFWVWITSDSDEWLLAVAASQ